MTTATTSITPQQYLQARARWHPLEIVFWLADADAVCPVSRLPVAGEPDRRRGAVRAVARPDPRLCRRRLARPRRLLRHRRLHRRHLLEICLGRRVLRPDRRRIAGGAGRLGLELHRRPLPPPDADHDHARPRPAARGSGQPRALADRRLRRPAGHGHRADLRRVRLRSLRQDRLRLFARRAVRDVPRRAAAGELAVRTGAARHPRELRAHAGDRRGKPRAHPHRLHHRRLHGRRRRRA